MRGIAVPDVKTPDRDVEAKVVIVTGGARGIGASLSRHLAGDGLRVILADVLPTEGKRLAEELRAQHREVHFQYTDVTDEASLEALVEATTDRFGRIDVLVNNAAIYQGLGGKKRFTDITVAEWEKVMAVNTRGVWLAIRAVYPVMAAQGFGRVINIASSTVHMGVPFFAHYTASKGAVMALTRSLAKEVGRDGITVNAVAPGLVENESSGMLNDADYFPVAAQQRAIPRSMQPTDLVGAVKFLSSDSSGFMTGQTLIVDGGVAFS
jgi:NAD(P)-dependent dehydrogenase (short-subunit alcohol dehydrogenase family)